MMTKLFSNRCFKVFMYVALFAITFVATSAYADGEVFTKISDKMISTFKSVRSIIFIVGGFGLVGLGFAAIFGKIKWTWLAALTAGVAIVILTVVGYNNVIQQASDTGQYEYTPEDGIDDSWE